MHSYARSSFYAQRARLLFCAFALVTLLSLAPASAIAKDKGKDKSKDHDKKPKTSDVSGGVLWADPRDIRSRDLFYGAGGKEDAPKEPLSFDKEDLSGTSPKFDVKDEKGSKWRAKTGYEARPETVATRLLWAVGYCSNENYFYPELQVSGMPPQLQRGQASVQGNTVKNVRLQRYPPGVKRVGDWKWKDKSLAKSREFNGLRVMMALLNNWDLKNENNAILEDEKHPDRKKLEVSDLGASFGRAGKSYTDSITKSNPDAYARTKFIEHVHTDYVDFNFPTHPPFLYVFNPFFFFHHFSNRWIGKHIPRQDAKWIGSLLAQLSPDQIRSAFRAGGYGPDEIEKYSTALQSRIADLNKL